MPYPRTLQEYTLPEFYAEPPEAWERRLREISPVTSNMDYLVFRKFEPRESWYFKDRPIWLLYTARPVHLVEKGRAAQFEKHWSELPIEPVSDECPYPGGAQEARKAVVSDYQHFMWHTRGLYVRPFLILQGEWGGTPAKYTEREKRYMDASGMYSEPYPIGFFPPVPFDERVVKTITLRDRLVQACNRYDELEDMDRPEGLKAEDEAAEALFRETYIDTMKAMAQPSIEYIKSARGKSEYTEAVPPASDGLADTVSAWKEHWLEHGVMPTASAVTKRALQIAVI